MKLLITAVTGLCSIVAYLWKEQVGQYKKTEEKLAKCEGGHQESSQKYLELSVDLAELRGRQDGVESLAKQVLETVATSVKSVRHDSTDVA